ncbi:hypothetical protein BYT27DRAFT_6458386 [Phlegmacium glaucopus]|nr:hypothetical protein BYT27DRAFT_6458386 [Phlegmacium glaucopus]
MHDSSTRTCSLSEASHHAFQKSDQISLRKHGKHTLKISEAQCKFVDISEKWKGMRGRALQPRARRNQAKNKKKGLRKICLQVEDREGQDKRYQRPAYHDVPRVAEHRVNSAQKEAGSPMKQTSSRKKLQKGHGLSLKRLKGHLNEILQATIEHKICKALEKSGPHTLSRSTLIGAHPTGVVIP